jgi:hypothetical protein
MLVTFESKVGRVTMFGDIAVQLIRMMGRTGTVPSALLAEDLPEALANLKRGLEEAEQEERAKDGAPPEDDDEESGGKLSLSLRVRAFPLVKLLEDSAQQDSDVLWEQEGSAPLRF